MVKLVKFKGNCCKSDLGKELKYCGIVRKVLSTQEATTTVSLF